MLHDGKVLIVRRARDPEKGRFDLPGGFLKFKEDPVSAVKREVREELGIEVDLSEADFIQAVPHAYGDEDEWVSCAGLSGPLRIGRARSRTTTWRKPDG